MEDLVLYLTSVFDSQYYADIPDDVKQICYAIIITTVAIGFFLACMIFFITAVLSIFHFIGKK